MRSTLVKQFDGSAGASGNWQSRTRSPNHLCELAAGFGIYSSMESALEEARLGTVHATEIETETETDQLRPYDRPEAQSGTA
jgi:hypothetical protein